MRIIIYLLLIFLINCGLNLSAFAKRSFLTIRPYARQAQTELQIQDKGKQGTKLIYRPNVENSKNLYLGLGSLGGSFGNEIEPSEEKKVEKGVTRYQDYQLHLMFFVLGIDLIYQRYEGFYRDVPLEEREAVTMHTGKVINAYPQYKNMKMSVTGANFFWFFNSKNFSYDAAFSQSEQQSKSGGSWGAMISGSDVAIDNPDPIIPSTQQVYYGTEGSFKRLRLTTGAFMVGGGYTFVMKKNFFFSVLFFAGPGYQRQLLEGDTFSKKNDVKTSRSNLKGALGYNGSRFFIGLLGMWDQYNALGNQITITPVSRYAEAFLGVHF